MPPDHSQRRPSRPPWRVVVAGGGVAGLSLALALRRALGSAVETTVFDPALARDPAGDRRAFALAAGARRMLQALDVWDAIADRAQPILDMVVTDSRLADPVRPVFLTFEGVVGANEPFAHMVESGALTAAGGGRRRLGRLVLPAIRNRGHDRPRAGPRRARGRALSTVRPVRHPAARPRRAASPPLLHRVDRAQRRRARSFGARPGRSLGRGRAALRPATRAHRAGDGVAGLSAGVRRRSTVRG